MFKSIEKAKSNACPIGIIFTWLAECLTLLNKVSYIPGKKETHHVELIIFQRDQKRWTRFVYIGSKVCQLLLHNTSFATRGEKCVMEIISLILSYAITERLVAHVV